MIRPIVVAALAVVLIVCRAAAAVISVPSDYPTIQQGIDAAGTGDTVLVAAGLYEETLRIGARGDLALIGAGMDKTTVDAGQEDRALHVQNPEGTTRITGIHFTRGFASGEAGSGAGIYAEGSKMVIESCRMAGNEAYNEGGGVNLTQCTSFTIRDCVFEGNTAIAGAALTILGGRGSVTGCRFFRNEGAVTVNLSFTGTQFDNNLLAHNTCTDFGPIGCLVSLSGSIRNNTIAYNAGGAGSGAVLAQSGENDISGNIIAFNQDLFALQVATLDNLITIRDNVLFENDGGDYTGTYGTPQDRHADPMFCDPNADNFMLKAASPCLEKGAPTAGAYGKGCN